MPAESRQYELMYIVAPTVGEEGVAELHTQVDAIVREGGGQIDKTDNWGRRRLAYEIGRHKEGTYVLLLFTGPAPVVRELERRLKVLDTVLRHLVVRVDEDLRKAERARTKRQTRQQRRRAAKGVPVAAEAPPPTTEGAEPAPAVPAGGESGDQASPEATSTTAPSTDAAATRVEVQE